MKNPCPTCGKAIDADQEASGAIGRCGSCKQFYAVGPNGKLCALGRRSTNTPLEQRRGGPTATRYSCGACGALIEPPPNWDGGEFACPSCGTIVIGKTRISAGTYEVAEDGPWVVVDPFADQASGAEAAASGPPPLPAQEDGSPSSGWFLMVGSELRGPVSTDTVLDMIHSGELQRSSRVWRDGFKDWAELGDVPEFSLLL